MELKLALRARKAMAERSLNRTFYGIETDYDDGRLRQLLVLIVPFMELKLFSVCFQLPNHGS